MLLLTRHGLAVPEGPELGDDDRFLTTRGRERVRTVGELVRASGFTIDAVMTSPLVRAVQTAELLAHILAFDGAIEAHSSLRPGAYPQVAARILARTRGDVLVVGHEPTISSLAAFLVGNPSFPSFKPGQIVILDGRTPLHRIDPDRVQLEQILID